MSADPFIQLARGAQVAAVIFGITGIGGLLWLLVQECLDHQREADERDRALQPRPPVERPAAPDETAFARDFREEFTRHHLKP